MKPEIAHSTDSTPSENLQQLRERLLNKLLFSALLVGTILLVAAMQPVLKKGLYSYVFIYLVVYIWLAVITFARRLSFHVRSASWLFFFLLLGVDNLSLTGFNSDAALFFLALVSMTTLIYDFRGGMIAYGVSLVFLALFGVLYVNGLFLGTLGEPVSINPAYWLIGGGVFTLISLILVTAITTLVQGLSLNLLDITDKVNRLDAAYQTLQQSEERYRSLVELSPDFILLLDLDGKVSLTNLSRLAQFGYVPEDLLGRHFLDFIHPSDRSLAAQVFQEAIDHGIVKNVVLRCIRKDTSILYAELSAALIRDANGNPRAVMSVSRDITARHEAERALQEAHDELEARVRERTEDLLKTAELLRENEATSRVILNASSSSLFLLDLEGRVLAANDVTARRLGRTMDEILGKPILSFFPEDVARTREAYVRRALETGKAVYFEDTRAGMYFENNIYPVFSPEGKFDRVVVSARDISQRKQLEQSLREARERLEERVTERTWALLDTQAELRQLIRERVQMQEEERRRVARELHDEAGQALISMKYSLESALAEFPGLHLPVRQRIEEAIQQLDRTMQQIRHLAHSLRPPLFDIADLDLTLRDFCAEFSRTSGVNVAYSGEVTPHLNEEAGLSFFRLVQEALTNVKKHAHATQVQVRLFQERGRLFISVSDNGVGLADKRQVGLGHIGMRERFMMLNGQVQILAQEGRGTTILASIPYWDESTRDEME